MIGQDGTDRRTNPFSTRYVRPGAVPFLFAKGQSAVELVRRLEALGWRAQIVGPHGAGKSTLVRSLLEPLARAQRAPYVVSLHDGQRRMPVDFMAGACAASAGAIVVDGYEQLSRWSRLRLHRTCRRHGWALVVTSHRDVGLPTLVELAPRAEVAHAIVERLLGDQAHLIPRDVVRETLAAAGGNVREMLFALYDRYEVLAGASGANAAIVPVNRGCDA
jgi:hypothetical protein